MVCFLRPITLPLSDLAAFAPDLIQQVTQNPLTVGVKPPAPGIGTHPLQGLFCTHVPVGISAIAANSRYSIVPLGTATFSTEVKLGTGAARILSTFAESVTTGAALRTFSLRREKPSSKRREVLQWVMCGPSQTLRYGSWWGR